MTNATIKGTTDAHDIDFDMDDSGWFYLKQDDDWICMTPKMMQDLRDALSEQLGRL